MVSYEYHDYPDATQECCLCHRYDCSTGDEKWLHLLTVETDGGYSPAIGNKCLSEIVANGAFAKAEPVVRDVVREPSDEELHAKLFDYVRRCEEIVKQHDNRINNQPDAKHHASASAGPKRRSTQTGTR